MQEKNKIFALDIGTRSVVGIILEEENKHFHVADIFVKEHTERAMLDGQIHDVVSVSKIIRDVKEEMEKNHGPLTKVCVAAAGRALKTEKAKVSISIKGKPMITKEDILHLELSAVQKAQSIAAEKNSSTESRNYYCVGYSVFQYQLDGDEIGSLIDQQGDEASVEIIATFLPRVVVESLISALNRADLEMDALTLEPIAAINVLIPASMRRLNVALVDIGAGTSDIALTELGTVTAYGMVPVAGDEITEAISDQLLLDFPLAEKAKRDLLNNESIVVEDILGFQSEWTHDNVVEQIDYAVDRLANAISNEIKQLNNGKSPKAVMLVGGGSLTPNLPRKIATCLDLPENRVAIRDSSAIQGLILSEQIPKGPEFITPIGIAIAAKQTPVHYVTVYVNDQPVRLFEVKQLTVGDCLLASGTKVSSLHGKPGMAIMIQMNGQQITIPGEHGQPPIIKKNGENCSLDEPVQNGDQIIALKGMDGRSPEVRISQFLDDIPAKTVYINEKKYEIATIIKRNGNNVTSEEVVADRDILEVQLPDTIEALLKSTKHNHLIADLEPFRIRLNGKETFLLAFSSKLFLNNKPAKLSHPFQNNDHIQVIKSSLNTVRQLAEIKNIPLYNLIHVFFNGEMITMKKSKTEWYRNDVKLKEDDIISHGDIIEMKTIEMEPFIFQDIFRHVEIDIPKESSGKFHLLKNGEETTFYEIVNDGDKLEILWDPVLR
ncbi:cell division FtsA domain-containing protein [Bacillus sp. FJAT-49736]|uniref:cell division FtsA domain-containing protein n=1 Tax=Bacillus sp. FJAT-49736 TaxID=2833582 RepID=UPI0020163929|nr:cell division FtsA domain-containing protein [Bacillus sp. FJAT-49736]